MHVMSLYQENVQANVACERFRGALRLGQYLVAIESNRPSLPSRESWGPRASPESLVHVSER
jgi:hypothetical protein